MESKNEKRQPLSIVVPDMQFYTMEQAAIKIGLKVSEKLSSFTLENAILNGELKAIKKGNGKYILHEDLLNYIKSGSDAISDKGKTNLPSKKPKNTEG